MVSGLVARMERKRKSGTALATRRRSSRISLRSIRAMSPFTSPARGKSKKKNAVPHVPFVRKQVIVAFRCDMYRIPPEGHHMRRADILVINPNSNPAVTAGLDAALGTFRLADGPSIRCGRWPKGRSGSKAKGMWSRSRCRCAG